jgi:hypothetical protein
MIQNGDNVVLRALHSAMSEVRIDGNKHGSGVSTFGEISEIGERRANEIADVKADKRTAAGQLGVKVAGTEG